VEQQTAVLQERLLQIVAKDMKTSQDSQYMEKLETSSEVG